MKRLSVLLFLVVLLASCSQQTTPDVELSAQAGSWQKLGGALDFTVEKNATNPRLLLDNSGNLIATWNEDNNGRRTYAEKWTGTGWQSFGSIFPVNSALLGFDSTNSPIISTLTSANLSVVSRWDATSKTWKQLGTAFDGFAVFPNQGNVLYSVLYSRPNGITIESQIVRRWNGSSWQNLYAPFKQNYAVGFDFDAKGRPRFYWFADETLETLVSVWNGKSWENLGVRFKNGFFDKNDQVVNALISGNVTVTATVQMQRNGQPLGQPFSISNYPTFSVDNLNRPMVLHGINGGSTVNDDLVLKRWTGSAWVNLGGVIDRIASRSTGIGNVLVDGKGTIYAIWEECVVALSDPFQECPNNNVYVSKYVP